nr:MAG TPA: hypothetical protein [Caudoviricetes sp.]
MTGIYLPTTLNFLGPDFMAFSKFRLHPRFKDLLLSFTIWPDTKSSSFI